MERNKNATGNVSIKPGSQKYWAVLGVILATIIGLCQLMTGVGAWLFPVQLKQQNTQIETPAPSINQPSLNESGGEIFDKGKNETVGLPWVKWISYLASTTPEDVWPLISAILGIASFMLASWLLYKSTKRYDNFDSGFVFIWIIIIFVISISAWKWWGILWGALLSGGVFFTLLFIPRIMGACLGLSIGILFGTAFSLFYLAVPGPFVAEYIYIFSLIGSLVGAITGFMVKEETFY